MPNRLPALILLLGALLLAGCGAQATTTNSAVKPATTKVSSGLGNGAWDQAAKRLGDFSNQIRVAQDAGDGVKLNQLEGQVITTCQADARQLSPDTSKGHSDVVQLCAILGVTVP